MFVHLTNRTEFLVHVCSFIKRTNINELPAERFTNCSLNVRFVYSPRWRWWLEGEGGGGGGGGLTVVVGVWWCFCLRREREGPIYIYFN
ncbi:hypothetical protein Hanom_Chr01g00039181 [Helianthus anomalus]